MKQLSTLALVFCMPIFLCAQIPNDTCEDAEALPDWDASNMTSATFQDMDATSSGVSPSCDIAPDDGWFSFVMPFDGNILVNGTTNCEMAIYESDAATCYGTEIYCASLIGNHAFGLSAGEEYVIQAYRSVGAAEEISFTLLATPLIMNDDCDSAEALPDWDANEETSATFNTNGASNSGVNPSCSGVSRDGWYSFTMPYDGNVLISGSTNCRMAIYTADAEICFDTEIYCGSLITKHAYNLVEGQDYIVQVYRILGTDGDLSFTLLTSPLIENDECTTAEAFPAWDSNNESMISFDTNRATPSDEIVPSCEISPPRDAWYSFTMPFEGQLFITGTSNAEIAIYPADAASCFNSMEVYCGNLSTSHAYNLDNGVDYIVRAYRVLSTDGPMNVTLEAVPKIAHDECVTAEEIVFDMNYMSFNSFDSNGASPSLDPSPSCETEPRDGWYVFESPINGFYDIQGSTFTEYAIYDECGGSEIACIEVNNDFPVVQGETYYIRAFRRLSTDGEMDVNLIPSVAKVAQGIPGGCESIPSITIDSDNNDEWVNIFDEAGDVVGSIKANGQNLGEITCNLEIDAEDVRIYPGSEVPYLRREVEISTEFVPTSDVDVRLYFLQDEAFDLLLADPNFSNIFNIEINKKDIDGCSGGIVGDFERIFNDKSGFYDEDDYYVEFRVSSFSTFYPGNIFSALPVELSWFRGKTNGKNNLLIWETSSEINSDRFEIERSSDGEEWNRIGIVSANVNSIEAKSYSFEDGAIIPFAYYRLKMVDINGSYEYSSVVNISNVSDRSNILIYPNPTSENFTLQTQEPNNISKVEIYTLDGKHMLTQEISNVTAEINIKELLEAVYLIKIYTKEVVEPRLLMKN